MREEWGRLVALLLAQFRRLDLVEDALGDAVEAASRTWPRDGAPDNPAGWLLTTARRRLLDRLRTEEVARRKHPLLATEAERRGEGVRTMADPGSVVEDDLLRLVLMCAHPALSPEAACALSLRLVLGVPTPDVARLFLVPEATMAARITRAKKRIVGAGIPFARARRRRAARPPRHGRPHRLPRVHRRLRARHRSRPAPRRDLRRGDPAGAGRARAATRRAGARRPPGAAAPPALAPRRPGGGRSPRAAPRPGPLSLAPRGDRRGARPARPPGAGRTDHRAGGVVHAAGADRRRARPWRCVRRTPGGSAS